ncbi:N-acylglucosamine 2-epimerase [bacterium]|nr:MAG: N-acylglucosamine 2-epimerase [bacterium]
MKYLLTVLTSIALIVSCKRESSYLGVPVSEIDLQLHSLLENYYPRLIDTINGGYWTNFENDWTLSSRQDKMLVTQARGLWTAARAAEIFPSDPVFRKAADHGFRFLTEHMWDTLNGGFYQNYYVDSVQKTDDSFKLTYGNAFALYGLAQYARINQSPDVLNWVRKSFGWLEEAVHDSIDRGYFSIAIAADNPTGVDVPEGWEDPLGKDQNTGIHLMEAFTSAYIVLPEENVKERLTEMLELVRDSMTSDAGYLNLFFDKKWIPISIKDSSRNYIVKNPWLDHISFGHNIETAYLLVDASKALYGSPDTLTLKVAKSLIDHTMQFGFDEDYYGLFDKGYEFVPGNPEVIDSAKVWWAQAEAWHALALFAGLYPKDEKYANAFGKMWSYVTKEVVDPQYGGWYNSGLDSNPRTVNERKAHAWKGCYHDGRALMQVREYSNKL